MKLVNARDDPIVVRKLCGALAAGRFHSATWERSIADISLHLIFDGNYDQMVDDFEWSLRNLSAYQLGPLLWFATSLVEDGPNVETNSVQS